MAKQNPTWGEERIAAELLLKLGIRISPRTVRRYLPDETRRRRGPSSQRWVTFVRNHAQGMLACDFFVSLTACATQKFRLRFQNSQLRQRSPTFNLYRSLSDRNRP